MAKVKITLCVGLSALLMAGSVSAQNPTQYIKWNGENDKFHTAYNAWVKGQPLYPNAAEDENFFISRVKIKDRFTNRNTQANPNVTDDNEKKLINWVPIGTTQGGNPNALPSGIFDSDVFSMWNMITHYGNWTAPLIRVPASFTDAAHKNGVSVSALGSVPFGASLNPFTEPHGTNLAALYSGGAEKFINFLKQYGIDGWGLNSEFTATTMALPLKTFMADAFAYAEANGLPTYSVAWYTLVNNNLSLSFADGLTATNKDWFHYNGRKTTNYYFGNYNWGPSQLQTNQDLATAEGRDPFDVYAGMNLQGAEGNRWTTLKDYKTSIGLWGAHDMNMFFNNRNENGGSPEAQQATYLTRNELFFTNGAQNPAKQLRVQNIMSTSMAPMKDRFHGISAFISAKSVLQWNLDDAPFYSFFNLGNGKFFNINGEKKYNGEWYNIGMQDYLPTWRYWFANTYLGREVADNGLKATFTWEDAWFGGSSLEITGTNAADEFFHLFKTKFGLKAGDKIKITFKVVNGSTDIKLVGSAVGSEATSVSTNLLAAGDIDLDEWVTKEITVGAAFRDFRLANRELAAIALQFSNAQDLKLRIGEFSISRGSVVTPEKPVITENYTRAYDYTYKGIDAKVVFSMPTPAGMPADARLYNDDVKTSFFKIYTRQEGGEANFVGATTSWAALAFAAPFDANGEKKLQIGVSAVGLDGVTESEIAWSELKNAGQNVISDEVVIDKPVIKPGELFTAGYADPNHDVAKWSIFNQNGDLVYEISGVKTFVASLNDVGIYNLKVSYNGQEETRAGFIQISGPGVGAMPQILTLTFNGSGEREVNAEKAQVNTLAYTGNPADGVASRGINLDEKPFGAKASEIGFDNTLDTSFSVGFWVKFKAVPGNVQLFQLRNPAGRWPMNAWGHIRTVYYPSLKVLEVYRRTSLTQGSVELAQQYEMNAVPGTWMHITFVFTAKNGGLQGNVYVNGVAAKPILYRHAGTNYNGYSDLGFATTDSEANNMFLIGGPVANGVAGVNGVLDDLKFFKSALTPDQVKLEMNQGMPTTAGAHGFWDFENEPVDNAYMSRINNDLPMKLGELQAGNGEGVNNFVGRASAVDAGSPFVPGTSFRVETKPSWTFSKGQLSGSTGNDTAGSANVTYNKVGTFTGTLTLTNSWGSDSKTIEVINIAEPAGIEMTDALSLQAFPNPFVEKVNIRFAAAGTYELAIYDLAGNFVSKHAVTAEAGDIVAFNLNTAPGTYLLRVTAEGGKLLQTIKLQSN